MEERIVQAFITAFEPRFNLIVNGLGNHIHRVDISDVNTRMIRAYDESILEIAIDRELDTDMEVVFTQPRAQGRISYGLYLKMQVFPVFSEYSQQLFVRIQELNTKRDE
ncbi:hypothetical protein [Maribacter sp. 1_MG-2023]|uniref:hypothetical protein n=1 Tax=Maribacter sp. 1_MG-2023 TaxID=3062677 RepID=UPI0026E2ABEA|nr:hypothetical protein [Maribacter sp. 1_MG-2023]MDO6472761.1 hypothetical protein [Maribacter sp. 1_MG-2023]